MAIVASTRAHTNDELTGLVGGLALASLAQMRRKAFPPLYESGIRYAREPKGSEVWQLAGETLASRQGDCEDLVAYRVAELWRAGVVGARPEVSTVRPGLRHVYVRYPAGQIEDPSLKLGMPVDATYWRWLKGLTR